MISLGQVNRGNCLFIHPLISIGIFFCLQQRSDDPKTSAAGTSTSNGVYGEHSGEKEHTFSATKTRFTCTTPSQAAARGLDASLKEIDSKDRTKKDDEEEGKEEV